MKCEYYNLSAPTQTTQYTGIYLYHLLIKSGFEIVKEANIIFCTVSDADSYISLRQLRRKNKTKKIICGGFEGYTGEWMLAFADVVVAGKGERFIYEFGKQKEIPFNLPEIYTKDTIEKYYTIPFEEVDIDKYPII